MRVLKRPMFRKGGSTGQGVMTGLVDRTNMDVGGRAKELSEEYKDILGKPDISELLITGGLNLVGGQGTGRGTLADIATAYQKPTQELLGDIKTRNLAAKKMGIEQAQAEKLKGTGSILAAEKKAKFLLPPDATAEQIRAKTAEIIESEMTGKTYSSQANYRRAYEQNKITEGSAIRARYLTNFQENLLPKLIKEGKNPVGKIKLKDKADPEKGYKIKGKLPGIYVDTISGKVIQITPERTTIELPELSKEIKK
jgi:hypothetical protein|tara:strand:+ start:115 stop:876 length:762 start_codon:yes stop_codon:yes gene_type:complete